MCTAYWLNLHALVECVIKRMHVFTSYNSHKVKIGYIIKMYNFYVVAFFGLHLRIGLGIRFAVWLKLVIMLAVSFKIGFNYFDLN